MFVALIAFTCVGLAWRSQQAHPREASAPQAPQAASSQAPFDVNAIMRRVHFSYRQEQDGWRGGHSTYEVKATAEGLSLTPTRYKEPEPEPRELVEGRAGARTPPMSEVETGAPLFLGSALVARGDTRLSIGAPRGKVEEDGHLAFHHGALVEHLRNSEQGVEQSWSFDAAPAGHGALRVDIPVKGLVHTGSSEQGLHFADARTGMGVRYGHGTWVDAKGRRTPIPAEYVHGRIQLRVPEEVLAASSYPAVLDPVISSEMIIDGRLVTADLTARDFPVLAFNGTNYLLVWRNKRGSQYSLYGARVSSTGTVLDTSGFVVSTGPGNTADPQVASNGTDFFVVWSQYHSQGWSIRGARVTSAGVVSEPGGKRISQSLGSQNWPHVASNGTDYLVAFYAGASDGFSNVYARRVSSTGQLLDTSDIPIATGLNYDETTPSVASNGTVYLVGWSDWRATYSRVYATRVSNAGVVLDGTGFELSSGGTLPQYMQGMASNGTDFLAVWLDYRNSGTRDLYGTRVTGSGTVVDGTGLAISTSSTLYESFATVTSNGTDYLAAWTLWNFSNSTYQNVASRVSASAPSASAVLDTTPLVLSANASYKHPSVARAGSDYLVAWDGTSSGVTDLYNAWVSSSGTVTAGSGFSITGVSSLSQTEPVLASNGSNYFVVWTDTTPSAIKIYGTRVSLEGGVLDGPGLELTTVGQERQAPAVTSNGTDYFVTWMDYRGSNWNIYGARVAGTGSSSSAVLDPNGFAISTNTAFEGVPAVASNGTDYFVVWRLDPGGQGHIYGARVTSAGVVLDTSGIGIATNSAEHYTPRVAFNGTNYLVVWAEYLSATNFDIEGARVSASGTVLDSPAIVIRSASGDQYEPDVASDGTDFLVVWTNGSPYGTDIYGARVSGAGAVLDTTPLILCNETVQEFSPKVVFDGTTYVSAWADYRWDSYWDVYATQVTSSGTVVTPNGFSVVYNARETEPFVSLATAGAQGNLVVFSRYDTEPNQGSRRIHGQFFWF